MAKKNDHWITVERTFCIRRTLPSALSSTADTSSPRSIECDSVKLSGLRDVERSPSDRIRELFTQAVAYKSIGDLNRCVDALDSAATLAKEQSLFGEAARAHREIAELCLVAGRESAAVDHLCCSAGLGQQLVERSGRTEEAIGFLASIFDQISDVVADDKSKSSIQRAEDALEESKVAGDRRTACSAHCELAGLHRDGTSYSAALRHCADGLALADELSDLHAMMRLFAIKGEVSDQLRDLPAAVDCYAKTVDLARQLKDAVAECDALEQLGNIHGSLLNHKKSLQFYLRSLDVAFNACPNAVSRIRSSVGDAFVALGRTKDAAPYHETATSSDDGRNLWLQARVKVQVAAVYYESGFFEEAAKFYQSAVECSLKKAIQTAGTGRFRFSLSSPYVIDQMVSSIDSDEAHFLYRPFLGLERSLLRLGKCDEALEATDRRRAFYLGRKFDEERGGGAFIESLFSEKGHVSNLSISHPISAHHLPYNPRNDHDDPISVAGMVHCARREGVTFVVLSQSRLGDNAWVVDADAAMPVRSAALDLSTLSDLVSPLTPLNQQSFPTVESKLGAVRKVTETVSDVESVGDAISELNLSTCSRKVSRFRQSSDEGLLLIRTLRQLYNLLLKPLEDWLPSDTSKPLVFILDALLWAVPMQALIDSKNQFLIQRFKVAVCPSIRTYERLSRRRSGTAFRSPLIVGNPDNQAFGALPGADAEAAVVQELIGGLRLSRHEATASAVKTRLTRASCAHFACHGGKLDDDSSRGFCGALFLASSDGQGAELSAAEIATMSIDAELAVLAACDSFCGPVRSEGVLGLPHAFLAAGVRSVVATLRVIRDRSTVDLVRTFYDVLKSGCNENSVAGALQEALCSAISSGVSVELWSPFILYGAA
ncbi:tetratricopeptide repeat protein 28-like [Oscarella lobularis]|uniref:tetratricopeptide repeat protein 28-like n=1 Tax=Oscarella lobularis TaxID=121494 RepID=UPI0033139F2F